MKFKVTKHFKLDFLGDEWKEAYLDFTALTVKDLKENFSDFSAIDTTNQKSVANGFSTVVGLLEAKFIGGKGVGDKGELVEIKKDDLMELPAEVITKALSFLSQGVTPA